MLILRSLLFVPGNTPRMLDRALGLRPDAFIPDMEDSVPWDEKANARAVTASYLPRAAETGVPVIPRVNSLDTGLLEADLEAVIGPHILGVSIGKVDNPQIAGEIEGLLGKLESEAGLSPGAIKLVPWIESAEAIVNAYAICSASERIVAVAFGAEDFTNDMEIERRDDDAELVYARSVIAVAARAAGVLALDTPYFAFRDPDGLRTNSLESRGAGFRGRFAIHPAQIDVINEVFSPSGEQIEHALRVIEAFEEAVAMGRGSTSLDGKVVDVPVVKRAQALLDQAKQMGMEVPAGPEARRLASPRSLEVVGVQHDSYRAVVVDRDGHVLLKPPRFDPETGLTKRAQHVIEYMTRHVGRGRIAKARPAAAPGVPVEGELADDQQVGPDVQSREVETSRVVSEDPKVHRFGDYVLDLPPLVGASDADEDAKSRADSTQDFVVNRNGRLRHPLDQRAQ